jgi:hypothetical protein
MWIVALLCVAYLSWMAGAAAMVRETRRREWE